MTRDEPTSAATNSRQLASHSAFGTAASPGWPIASERTRQRELCEDTLRNFEHRPEAYVSFYESLREMARMAYDHGLGLGLPPLQEDGGELPFEWNMPTARELEHLRVYVYSMRPMRLQRLLAMGPPHPTRL
jgi:hypothetical protein